MTRVQTMNKNALELKLYWSAAEALHVAEKAMIASFPPIGTALRKELLDDVFELKAMKRKLTDLATKSTHEGSV